MAGPTPEALIQVEAAVAAGAAVVVASEDPAWGAAIAAIEGRVALLVGTDPALAEAMGADLFPGARVVVVAG